MLTNLKSKESKGPARILFLAEVNDNYTTANRIKSSVAPLIMQGHDPMAFAYFYHNAEGVELLK